MINKLHQPKKQNKVSTFFKSVALTGGMLLFVLKPNISKGNEDLKAELQKVLKEHSVTEWKIQESDKSNEKTAKFEAVRDTTNALTFATNNVDKYYPDMKGHLDTLLSNFWNNDQKNAVDSLLNEHIIKNIVDPKQRTAAIIYSIEKYAYLGNDKIQRRFSQLHVKDIDKTNAQFIFNGFGKGYVGRFNGYYSKLQQFLIEIQKKIDQHEKSIENQKKEIEGIIGQFTVTDVKTKPDIKKLILDTEILYIKHKYTIFPHLAELIKIAKE